MDIEYTKLLREKAAGVLRGQKLKKFKEGAKFSKTPMRKYKPKSGENWEDVYKRARKFFIRAADFGFRGKIQNVFDTPKQFSSVLVVTHGGWVMEALNYIYNKVEGREPVLKNTTRNCSLTTVQMFYNNAEDGPGGDGSDEGLSFKVVDVNDVEHIVKWENALNLMKRTGSKRFSKLGSGGPSFVGGGRNRQLRRKRGTNIGRGGSKPKRGGRSSIVVPQDHSAGRRVSIIPVGLGGSFGGSLAGTSSNKSRNLQSKRSG